MYSSGRSDFMAKISRIEPKKKRLQEEMNVVDTLEGMPDAVDSFDEGT